MGLGIHENFFDTKRNLNRKSERKKKKKISKEKTFLFAYLINSQVSRTLKSKPMFAASIALVDLGKLEIGNFTIILFMVTYRFWVKF